MKIDLCHSCGRATCLLAFLLTTSFTLAAEAESPYAGLEKREIKALSEEQIAAYETGLGMGLAMAAELQVKLRVVHLQAQLRMKEILTAQQIGSYIRLRGYHANSAHPGHASKP